MRQSVPIPGVDFSGGLRCSVEGTTTALLAKWNQSDSANHMMQPTKMFLGMEAVIESEQIRTLLGTIERVARSQATVLITGESGSGKELIARAVHHYSSRSHKPWVDLSCAALPEHLIESELFGYEKGAFSGADTLKPGLFEMATGGTIFLDEIGELDPRMQVKLLRVLDSVAYYRLGGTKKVSVDVRVVAATNQDLEKAVAEGKIRIYGTATWNAFRVGQASRENLSLPDLLRIAEEVGGKDHHFRAIQLPYNLAMPEALSARTQRVEGRSTPVLQVAREHGMLVFASASLLQQKLANDLPAETHAWFPGIEKDAQRAIQFVRSTPGISSALVGMSRTEHLAENLSTALTPPLNLDQFRAIFNQ